MDLTFYYWLDFATNFKGCAEHCISSVYQRIFPAANIKDNSLQGRI